ncbi:MAG: hypothetical protein IJ859_10920 [Synergistaceae bacterium]|nr:hypothetical protein [Synergistaceae bacterium]
MKFQKYNSAAVSINILEDEINKAIKGQELKFTDDDEKEYVFHDIKVDITTSGLTITGKVKEKETTGFNSYVAAFLLGTAADDYDVTITTSKINVENNVIWLDNPKIESQYEAINTYIRKYINQRVDLKKEMKDQDFEATPLTLGSIELKNGSITITTAASPTAITGTTYKYPKSAPDNNSSTDEDDSSNNDSSNDNDSSSNGNDSDNNNNNNDDASSSDNNSSNNNNSNSNNSSSNLNELSDNTKANFLRQSVQNLINAKLQAVLGTLAQNFPFKATAKTTSGGTKNITNAQLNSALGSDNQGETMLLPTQTVSEPGTYILGAVSLSDYEVGTKIALFMLVESATGFNLAAVSSNSNNDVKVAETVSKGAFFTDANGNTITEVPSSGEVIAIAPMEAGVEYIPVITLAEESKNAIRRSGDGCDIGLGAITLAILSLAFFKKH